MESKVFLKRFALIIFTVIIVMVTLNIIIDIYGLFLGRDNRKVYVNERTSKYLLSFRYIPENYEGFFIGPSLSANLNPRELSGFKIYNSSIMGANISDLHYLINNMLEKGNMRVAIICLDPYLTKDFGKKAATIDPKEYYGALGSTNLLKTYLMYFIRKYNFMPETYAPEIIDENGWNNFELEMKDLDPQRAITEKVRLRQHEETGINAQAYEELNNVIQQLRAEKIKIVAYFSPVPRQIYDIAPQKYSTFEHSMKELFTPEDIVINLNDETYKDITSDYALFIDHGHLSAKGQNFVLKEINAHLRTISPK